MEAYLVTDRRLASESFLPRLVREAAAAGVDRIQVREKDLGGRALLHLARDAMEAARDTRATVFVNDRLDVALAASAPGLHLGRSGLPLGAVRRWGGEDLVLGASAHTLEEAMEAQEEGADYLFFGPVFPTPSKAEFGPPVGIAGLEAVLRRVRIPVYAIGGIGPDNLRQLRGLPLIGVAMIAAFVRAASVPELIRLVHGRSWE
ncbi:MAG TPA: thiamine phosphate synthase [Candidatus Polarisedimenticolia bacterium]|nr:thiamine phosphate synthase [Candidatus Polarisedimenticolia bacterium]